MMIIITIGEEHKLGSSCLIINEYQEDFLGVNAACA